MYAAVSTLVRVRRSVATLVLLLCLGWPASIPPAAAVESPWISFTRLQGLASDSTFALDVAGDGHLWVGTNAGLGIRSPAGDWLTLTSGDGLSGDIIADIAPVPGSARRRWVATDGGATLLDDGGRPLEPAAHTLFSYGLGDNLVDTSVSAVAVDQGGRVWMGTGRLDTEGNESGAGISVLNPGARLFDKTDDTWTAYSQAGGNLSGDVVRDIVVDQGGTVWVATQSGLDAFRDGQRTAYTTAKGLPSNNVRALLAAGTLLWAATEQGLAVLEGGNTPHDQADDTWAVFNTGNSPLTANSTKSLARDATGRIWVSTNWIDRNAQTDAGAGVSVLDPKGTPLQRGDDVWVTFRAAEGLASDAVRAVLVSGGAAYFGTKAGVSQLRAGPALGDKQDDVWRTFSASNRLAGFAVNAMAAETGGLIWLGTDEGLSLLDYKGTPQQRGDDIWRTLTTDHHLPSNTIRALARDQRGWLWVGTNAGLHVRDLKGTPGDPSDDEKLTYATPQLRVDQINDIVIDAAGRAWIACGSYFEGALHVLDPGASLTGKGDDKLATFDLAAGLPDSYVRGVALDGASTAWVATDGGAARLAYGVSPFDTGDDTWTVFTAANSGLGHNLVRDVARDRAGRIWFALALKGVSVYSAGTWTSFAQSDGLISNAASTLMEDSRGQIWIGTTAGVSALRLGAGLGSKADDQWTSFGAAALTYDSVSSMLIDGKGQIWAGTFGGASLFGPFIKRYVPTVSR